MRNASNATTPKDSESLSDYGLSGQHPVDEPQGLRADPGPTNFSKLFVRKCEKLSYFDSDKNVSNS